MKKRILTALLASAMILSVAGCDSTSEPAATTAGGAADTTTAAPVADDGDTTTTTTYVTDENGFVIIRDMLFCYVGNDPEHDMPADGELHNTSISEGDER